VVKTTYHYKARVTVRKKLGRAAGQRGRKAMWSRIAAVMLACLATAASAQELTIALGRSVTSIDPHFHNTGPNNSVAVHLFDRLIHHDAKQRPVPGLALSWRPLDDLTWEFKLRSGV